MVPSQHQRLLGRFRRLSAALALSVGILGLLVLIGWFLDAPFIAGSTAGITMQPSTALCFTFISMSLWLSRTRRRATRGRWALALAMAVACIAGAKVLVYLTEPDTAPYQPWLLGEAGFIRAMPGRMSLLTAMAFIGSSLSLALLHAKGTFARITSQILACLIGALSLHSFTTYLFKAEFLVGPKANLQMTILTTLGFLALTHGLLLARPSTGLMVLATSDSGPGRVFRRMVPAILGLPLLLGWIALTALRAGWLGAGTAMAVLVLGTGALLLSLLWVSTAKLLRVEKERNKAEQALKTTFSRLSASEAKSRALLEGAGSGFGLLDGAGVVWEVNRRWEEIFGLDRGHILGHAVSEFLAPQDQAYLQARVRKLTNGEDLPPTEWEIPRRDGHSLVVESIPAKVDLDGRPFILVALNDVTERNRLRRQAGLNERLATVGTLSAGIVHEINNPTAVVLGNLEIMAELLAPESSAAMPLTPEFKARLGHLTGRALQGVFRIREIVGSIKGFARVDDGEKVLVDVVEVMEAALTMSAHEFKGKAKVKREFAADLPRILGNAGRLQQVFVNLLVNAAQALAPGAPGNCLTIRIQCEEEYLRVEVEDNGPGIPPEIKCRIFDPFFTTKPVGKGTGLGLSICHEIVRQHGGEIGLESELGKGTRFCLTLSTLRAVEEPQEVPNPVLAAARILLVDDDPLVLAAMQRVLRHSFQVITAEGGRAAMRLLEQGNMAAIVTDLNMPDVNGMDLFHHVAKTYPAMSKRVVFFTGSETGAEFKCFLRESGLSCLYKPFAAEDLERLLTSNS